MSVTFRLDDVSPATDRRAVRRFAEAIGEALAMGGDPELAVIDHGPTHPLLGAVHVAFAEHRPLVLSPDAVWLTIAQGVAQHVRLHAEALRPRLVRHAGKKALEVALDGPMPTDAAAWATIVAAFRDSLAEEIGGGRARLLECDFSTTTEVERVASQIVLMDVYSHYFDYYLYCVCGIPEVTLLGTPDDWRRIRERIEVLAELDLEFWTRSLVPIAQAFVDAASGRPDLAFWRRIYKPRDAYGGDVITGWSARLYPYLIHGGQVSIVNPLLELPIDEPRDAGAGEEDEPRWYAGPGIRSDMVPAGPCTARVQVVDIVRNERRQVALHGGVLAVAQDPEGRLGPVCGWILRAAGPSIAVVLDRIRAEHACVAATAPAESAAPRICGPADVVGLYRELDEATLFAETRRWWIRPLAQHERIAFVHTHGASFSVDRCIDLPDGRFVALAHVRGETALVLGRSDAIEPPGDVVVKYGVRERRSTEALAEVPVLDMSLAELLDAALAANGAPELPSTRRLIDVVPKEWLEPPPPRPAPRKKPRRK